MDSFNPDDQFQTGNIPQSQPQAVPQGQPPVNPQINPQMPPQQPYVQYVQPVAPNAQPVQQVPPNPQFTQQLPPNPQCAHQVPPNVQFTQQVPPNVQYGQPLPPNVQYAQPAPSAPDPGRKTELLLCFLSLGLHLFAPGVASIAVYMLESINSGSGELGDIIATVGSSFGSIGYIASWVLMIIARVKFKKSVFAKVLMWVYIGLLVATVAVVVFIIVSCINALRDCPG